MAAVADRLRRSLRPPRQLRFTRQGKWFTAMTFLVGFGAINTGNNLLYLLLGMMLGLILVSGVMSEAMLRGLFAERLAAEPIYAGRTARLEYRVGNRKRRLPSFSIEAREVETRRTREWRRGAAKARAKRRAGRRVKRFLGAAAPARADEEPIDRGVPRCFVHRVAAGAAVVRSGHVRLPRRGLYRYEGLALVTRFPFGFFEKSRQIDDVLELLVYPRIVEAPSVSVPSRRREGVQTRRHSGRGFEYHGLRDYRDGEDWRRIHWKVSARRPGLVVRENEQEHTRTLAIALMHTATGDGIASRVAVERAIEVAAAVARERIGQGFAVALATQAGTVSLGRGRAQMGRILRALALLEVDAAESARPLRSTPSGIPVVLVAPDGWSNAQAVNADATVGVDARGVVRVAT